jgi:polysaccharide biosynthesis/export protein
VKGVRLACAVLIVALATLRVARAQMPDVTPPTPPPGAPSPDAGTGSASPGEQSPDLSRVQTEKLSKLRSVALSGPVDPRQYRLGPGDVLVLQLWGAVSRTIPLEIGPEGTVLLPGAGSVRVDGWTLEQARDRLLDRMRPQFRHVSMDLRLGQPRTFLVYVTGRVRVPGPLEASGANRVADLLSPAALDEDASRRHIDLLHRDGTRETADLELFLRTGNASLNPWLRDGDVLRVPAAVDFAWAQGALAEPGRYELGPSDSVLTLLRLAGDPLPSAEAGRAMLVRFATATQPESLWFSLPDVYSGKTNVPVQEGDRLYVYFIPRYHEQQEATIVGEVQRPGTFPIAEGRTRLSYLVQAAEGFLPTADLSAIRVHRRNPNAGERDPELDRLLRLSRNELTASEYEKMRTRLAELREDYRIDWNRLQREKDLDLLLRDGDIVRVEPLVSSIRVDGEVARPGILAYARGLDVVDYVREAGGFTERAWRGKVRVTRAVTGQTLLARNVRSLDPGDFIWVPEKPDVTVWQQAREVLTALASIATVVIAIRSVR